MSVIEYLKQNDIGWVQWVVKSVVKGHINALIETGQ